jgi:hypothetical protein
MGRDVRRNPARQFVERRKTHHERIALRRRKRALVVGIVGSLLGASLGVGMVWILSPTEDEILAEYVQRSATRPVDTQIDRVLAELWRMEATEMAP